jgi:hypothetical protein
MSFRLSYYGNGGGAHFHTGLDRGEQQVLPPPGLQQTHAQQSAQGPIFYSNSSNVKTVKEQRFHKRTDIKQE